MWEFGCRRRDPDGRETTLHLFVEHDLDRAAQLPEPFRTDHDTRYDPARALSPAAAAGEVCGFTSPLGGGGTPAVVGCVPSFDMYRLETAMRRFGLTPGWHYRPVCVETVAAGWLLGLAQVGVLPPGMAFHQVAELCQPPWSSAALSRACGVDPPPDGVRHTVLGDIDWGVRWWDRIDAGPYDRVAAS